MIARLRRRGEHDAVVRGVLRVVRDGQLRPAGHLGLRRRVHGDPRRASRRNLWSRSLAATTLILGAAYTLWMVKRVIFGDGRATTHVAELHGHQRARVRSCWACSRVGVLAIGLWPKPLTDLMDTVDRAAGEPAAATKL